MSYVSLPTWMCEIQVGFSFINKALILFSDGKILENDIVC